MDLNFFDLNSLFSSFSSSSFLALSQMDWLILVAAVVGFYFVLDLVLKSALVRAVLSLFLVFLFVLPVLVMV